MYRTPQPDAASPLSRAQRNRLRRSQEIERHNFPSPSACDQCLAAGSLCLVLPDKPELACSECTRRGRRCTASSWESLDNARNHLNERIAADEQAREVLLEQLQSVQTRLARLRIQRASKEREALEKFTSLIVEAEEAGEDVRTVIQTRHSVVHYCDPDHQDLQILQGLAKSSSWQHRGIEHNMANGLAE